MFLKFTILISFMSATVNSHSQWSLESSKTCPDYSSIRQDSVDADLFKIDEIEGKWFFLATNEPTIPAFCICGYNNFTIEHEVQKYEYTSNLICRGSPFTIHIKGNLSSDSTSPGNLVENAEILDNCAIS